MRTTPSHFTQTLLPFNNVSPTKIPLPRAAPFIRMAESTPPANTPAPHPIQPQPDPKQLPPPPEKPEPGDCCGSGCVRCVWDLYYEELEQYDKLYKQHNSNPKPS
ncbi:hypothetical protein Fmac_014963 [Flemingia macrophylla]|uniref:Oxidoreductase-like domain-containing protein n=1 Tax=Flemingia macrophylla TaxID=520843 RepID=A0ABD1MD69_9FABA